MSDHEFKVSVILPTYNRRWSIERAIQSVFAQTYRQWQLWIVDDGSTDGTSEWLERTYPSEISTGQLTLIRQDNLGVSAARNAGIKASKSPWVALLDSDDEWTPDKLEKQLHTAEEQPHRPLIHGEEIWIRNGVRVNPKKKHKKSGGRIFSMCVPLCCISPSAALIKRNLIEDVGLFDETFTVCEDYEYWLRVTSKYEVGFVEDPIVIKHGGHDDQLSRKYKAMDYYRVKALREYLVDPHLSPKEIQLVCHTMTEKCRILISGYEKHQNTKYLEEVKQWTRGILPNRG